MYKSALEKRTAGFCQDQLRVVGSVGFVNVLVRWGGFVIFALLGEGGLAECANERDWRGDLVCDQERMGQYNYKVSDEKGRKLCVYFVIT